jgi:hypothetical protein
MEAARSSEALVFYHIPTLCRNSEDLAQNFTAMKTLNLASSFVQNEGLLGCDTT